MLQLRLLVVQPYVLDFQLLIVLGAVLLVVLATQLDVVPLIVPVFVLQLLQPVARLLLGRVVGQ